MKMRARVVFCDYAGCVAESITEPATDAKVEDGVLMIMSGDEMVAAYKEWKRFSMNPIEEQ